MIYRLINSKTNEIIRIATHDIALAELTKLLWDKYIAELKGYTKKYQFNYSNNQTITFTVNGFIHKFTDVPTSMGLLDSNKIIEDLKEVK